MTVFPFHRPPFDPVFIDQRQENTFSGVSSSSSWSSTDATSSSLNSSGLLQTIQSMFDDPTIRTLTCVLIFNIAIILIIITICLSYIEETERSQERQEERNNLQMPCSCVIVPMHGHQRIPALTCQLESAPPKYVDLFPNT